MAVWVKICGVTGVEDARAALEAGADAIGLNFVGGPRKVTDAVAQTILEVVPPGRVVVALVTLGPDGLQPPRADLFDAYGVRHLQVYGTASSENINRLLRRDYRPLMVCRPGRGGVRASLDAALSGLVPGDLFAVVLDAHAPGQQGGTGKTLDWQALAQARERGEWCGVPPVILAGGLTPQNVGKAIEIVRPWGVDVSSGVESGPGRKDREALFAFVRAAKGAA